MVNTSGDDVYTMIDEQPILLLEHGHQMSEHTPGPQLRERAPWTESPEPRARPPIPEAHPLRGLEHLGHLTLQKPLPAVPTPGKMTLRDA
jgi:hypothetical protein